MPRFSGTLSRTFITPASPERVLALLSDRQTWVRLQEEIEHATEVGDDSLDLVLREHVHGPARFQARYRCRWARAANSASWDSVNSDNFGVHGTVRVRSVPGGTEVVWNESVDAEVPVPRMLVRVVQPIAETLMARGLNRFVDIVMAELARS